jgi:hypothetical protein
MAPAVRIDGAAQDVMTIQRTTPTHELYFIANTGDSRREIDVQLRDARGKPEIWHPDNGCRAPAVHRRSGTGAAVPLQLAAGQSLFVVVPADAPTPGLQGAGGEPAFRQELDEAWQLSFPAGRGAPAGPLALDRLAPWNHSEVPGVRYFSGTATYRKTIQVDGAAGQRMILDLGEVRDLASVKVNGQPAGTAWKAPYRFDLGKMLHPGANELEVEVTNLWVNRLVGDAQADGGGKEGRVTAANGIYAASAPLRDAGLLGPVRLLSAAPGSCVPGIAH